ncbi:unnamed protein product, partial [Citrullus colocynthis]
MLTATISKCCINAKDSSKLEALVACLVLVVKVVNIVGLTPRLHMLQSSVVVVARWWLLYRRHCCRMWVR